MISLTGKLVLLIACSLCLLSCDARGFCGEYKKLVEEKNTYETLVAWADKEIFTRTFEQKDFRQFDKFVGPGKGGADFDIQIASIKIPPILQGYVIRSVGPNRFHPDVILVGKRRYQGILITKGDFHASLGKIEGEALRIEEQIGRTGTICYGD